MMHPGFLLIADRFASGLIPSRPSGHELNAVTATPHWLPAVFLTADRWFLSDRVLSGSDR
jgi:hypothetical protein